MALDFHIKLEFGNVAFWEVGKTRKNLFEQKKELTRNSTTYMYMYNAESDWLIDWLAGWLAGRWAGG